MNCVRAQVVNNAGSLEIQTKLFEYSATVGMDSDALADLVR